MGYDPSDELFGADFKPRNLSGDLREPRSWFGPNGQYVRELQCPTCRGRGNDLFKEQKYPEAVRHYTEAIKRNPKDPRAYDNAIELDPTFSKGYSRKTAVQFLNEGV